MNDHKNNVDRHLSRATIIIAAFSLLSRLVGLLRDRIFASHFGASDTLDVYYAAFRLPDFIFNLLILGTLSAAFIPVFMQYLVKDEKQAWKIANSIFNLALIIMGLISIVLAAVAPFIVPLIVPGFSADKQAQTLELTRIMLLSPVFFALSSVFSSVLNSLKRFTVVAALPVIYNLAIIFGIYVLYPFFGAQGLAWGVVAGSALHMILQIPSAYKIGFRWRPELDLHLPGLRKIVWLFLPRVLSMDLGQISYLVSVVIGSTLSIGSISVYTWASNLQAVPLGVFAIAFATVAFSALSEAAAKGDRKRFLEVFNSNFSQILFVIIPLSSLMLIMRAQIVRLILGAGEFDWSDTKRTLAALGFFSLSLFAQSLVPLLTRAFFSLQNTVVPVISSLIAAAINIGAALFLMPYFEPGMRVAALALAFSIAAIAQFLILFVWLEFQFGNILDRFLILKLVKILVSTVLMGIVAYGMKFVVVPYLDTRTYFGLLGQTAVASLLGLAVYVGFGALVGLSESRHLVSWGKTWLEKIRGAFARQPNGI